MRGMNRAIIACCILLLLSLEAHAEALCLPFGDGRLAAGVLEMPERDTATVAVILPGTHTATRDGPPAIGREGLYAALARSLREQGLAVARLDMPIIDDRGGAGCANPAAQRDPTMRAQRASFTALARWLREPAPGHRFTRVLFVGHSQGSLLGAQMLAAEPGLADGFYFTGMTLGPIRELIRGIQGNVGLSVVQMYMDSHADGCIRNEALLPLRPMLEAIALPFETWLSPSGAWCRGSLHLLRARIDALVAPMAALAAACDPALPAAVEGIGNTCEEMRLFVSNDAPARLLANYPGVVGVAFGIHDPILRLGDEGEAFRRFAEHAPGPRRSVLLDMGHSFGDYPFAGPGPDTHIIEHMRAFARFVAAP
jgi:pimeloyl-ACP methyl ester carboxylesterase